MKTGIAVYCSVCGRAKKPHARSAPIESAGGYCDSDCRGYDLEPKSGCLWPNETAADFGYQSCDNATEDKP